MPCSDGVMLASRIWRPPGAGPWPVLLMRQPYGRAIASTVTYAHPRWYAERGFLVVVQDVRGRGDSQGRFAGFAQESADGAEAVLWCRRLEGASGRVGSYGFSYQGFTQLLAGSSPAAIASGSLEDPLPDCLAPAMCGLDERLHWASEGGAHWWSLGLGWALQLAAQGCQRRSDDAGWLEIRRSLESGAYLHQGLELLRRHDPEGMGLAWLSRDPRHPEGWCRHSVSRELLLRPMLLIGGWHDPHLQGVLDLAEQSLAAGGQPQLHIGAWSHLDWSGGIDELQLAFFRRHLLKATAPAAQEPASVSLQCPRSESWSGPIPLSPSLAGPGQGQVDAAAHWQLASAGLAVIRVDEGQLLACPGAPPEPGDGPALSPVSDQDPAMGLTLVHDPWRPVPSRGGHLGPEPGLCERADLDRRADVACFQSDALEQPLSLLGRPLLRIGWVADQPGADLWATLSVVRPDGSAQQLCSGLRRLLGEEALTPALRLLEFQPCWIRLAAGERLRLSLAASAWPAIAVNPGDGSLPNGGSSLRHRVISLDLDLATAHLWFAPLIGANCAGLP